MKNVHFMHTQLLVFHIVHKPSISFQSIYTCSPNHWIWMIFRKKKNSASVRSFFPFLLFSLSMLFWINFIVIIRLLLIICALNSYRAHMRIKSNFSCKLSKTLLKILMWLAMRWEPIDYKTSIHLQIVLVKVDIFIWIYTLSASG